jgi:hypothetical protein
MLLNMYVYLSTDGRTTQIATSSEKKNCSVEQGFRILVVLEVAEHLVSSILLKWKRESRGPVSRVNKGFKIAKQYMLRSYVSDENLGELGELQKFEAEPGKAKPVPLSFWENL